MRLDVQSPILTSSCPSASMTDLSGIQSTAWTSRGHHKSGPHTHRAITGEQPPSLSPFFFRCRPGSFLSDVPQPFSHASAFSSEYLAGGACAPGDLSRLLNVRLR